MNYSDTLRLQYVSTIKKSAQSSSTQIPGSFMLISGIAEEGVESQENPGSPRRVGKYDQCSFRLGSKEQAVSSMFQISFGVYPQTRVGSHSIHAWTVSTRTA